MLPTNSDSRKKQSAATNQIRLEALFLRAGRGLRAAARNRFVVYKVVAGALLLAGVFAAWQWWEGFSAEQHTPAAYAALPDDYAEPAVFTRNDAQLRIAPLNANNVAVTKTGNIYRYPGAYPYTDVVHTDNGLTVKEELILHQPGHPTVFRYQLENTEHLTIRIAADGSVVFHDARLVEQQGGTGNLTRVFTIAPSFVEDAAGKKSFGAVATEVVGNTLQITLDKAWLADAQYPVVVDPTVEINILNLHSHPRTGEDWTVDFTTTGTADLRIIPDDQATVADDEFTSLACIAADGTTETREPVIESGDVIFYENWNCEGTGRVVHHTLQEGKHTLRFEFGGAVAYAYNTPVTDSFGDTSKIAASTSIYFDTAAGQVTLATTTSGELFRSTIGTGNYHACAVKTDGSIDCWFGSNTYGQATPPSGTDFVQVVAGPNFSCAVKTDNSLECWGDNTYGQIDAPPGTDYAYVSAGDYHACSLKIDGSIVCWGDNGAGQLNSPPGTDYKQITNAYRHGCALKNDNSIVCWGDNAFGQATPLPGSDYVKIAALRRANCALKNDGSIVCWGRNEDGSTASPPGNDFARLDEASYTTMCAIKNDGSTACWGRNFDGQATPLVANNYAQVAAGLDHTCAVKTDNSLVCWGDNSDNRTTPPSSNDFVAPVNTGFSSNGSWSSTNLLSGGVASSIDNFVYNLSAKPAGTSAVAQFSQDGSTWYDANGVLDESVTLSTGTDNSINLAGLGWEGDFYYKTIFTSDGTDTPVMDDVTVNYTANSSPTILLLEHSPSTVDAGGAVTFSLGWDDVDVGESVKMHICATDSIDAQTQSCAGDTLCQSSGFTTNSTTTCSYTTQNEDANTTVSYYGFVCDDDNACSTSGSGTFSVNALTSSIGGQPVIFTPGVRLTSNTRFKTKGIAGQLSLSSSLYRSTLSVGMYHGCAVKLDGSIDCWGSSNGYGQATDPSGTDYDEVASALYYNCAVKTDNSLHCWGDVPATPGAGTDYAQIATANNHMCAMKTDGSIACWGSDNYGESTPPAGTDFVQVTVGSYHTCALKNDGSIECWGRDLYGESTPPAGTDYIKVASTSLASCALKNSGSIVCWGRNNYGQSTPPVGTDFVRIDNNSAGDVACAIKNDDSAVCWGRDSYGQATPPAGSFAQPVGGITFSCGVKTDNSLACWGYNPDGRATPPGSNDFATP